MKKITIIISAICILILNNLQAQTIIHVATTGSDTTGKGTESKPYRTLQKAENKVSAGDTVYVHKGTYRNSDFNDGDIWEGENLLQITANGTAEKNITFKPFTGDEVILEFDGTYGIIISNSTYINVEGFILNGIAENITKTEAESAWGLYKDSDGVIHDLAKELNIEITDPNIAGTKITKTATPGIKKPSYYNGRGIVANKSYHINILNNEVKNVPSSAIRCQQSDNTTIANNIVYNNTYWTTLGVGAITVAEATPQAGNTSNAVKIILSNNYVHHNENRLVSWNPTKTFVNIVIDEGTGLFLTRNRDTYSNGAILIANNISTFNGASGIVSHFTNNVIIEHNTIYKNGTTNESPAGGIGINNTDNVTIINNISYAEPDHWAIGVLSNPNTNLTISNNLVYNEDGSENIDRNLATGWIEKNPLFEDSENGGFLLKETSPAINNGTTNATQTTDYFGNLRDSTPDIGAIEFGSVLGIKDEPTLRAIQMYPNPTKSFIYFNFESQNIKKGTLEIFDLKGSLIYKAKIQNKVLKVNLSNKKGLYIAKINTRKAVFYQKIIKE
ncbi:T9SS type A sorting domain-containing protein [Polaribacter sp. R77954]|uniref:T9SS type A sorting domain-containing protein n=1 Tax=Polaribacter sp. R77954 TaxID=3093870 RepID=UPI0037CC5610